LSLALLPYTAAAQEAILAPQESEPEPAWTAKLGLSYLATSGNSDTETLGFDVEAVRRPAPWGVEIAAQFNRAQQDGDTTAERYHAAVRGTRALDDRWDAFFGLSLEQDEFSGIDLRSIAEAGAVFKLLRGPRHAFDLDFAVTWTDEQRLAPDVDDSWVGALVGADYDFEISDSSTFSQHVRYFPNLDNSRDWRADSVTALTAALNQHLALRLSYEVRYRNQPIGDNDDTDTTSKVSLVWSR
jgi:putative salt-induced outer membrane protein